MTFAGVLSIDTTPTVIEPLLVKYRTPLPSTIRYVSQNDVDEIDVSQISAYYIFQNPAYITPANRTILSSTAEDGSVAFGEDVVPVGSGITIDDRIYNVRGVGSSLLDVAETSPEPVPSGGDNTLSVVFAIIAGVILLIIFFFSIFWKWEGYMILPAVIAIVMLVLAVVYAF
jgi:VIT1/CCC1 family predicted Fe2+/Mn2+ transporter